ncbi:cholesterol oxidase [Actinomadura pelletieri DSM 43383]|uniref:Cholesterol oxidase n=1 Tax=Actinomadura pelletieri DSM 43383 TaxID=1120940 RepID=A0A495QC29_9ACTN|nr:GMC family oxidoreductase [Actinomadura pelletieri]RKS69111.1 cholesterol oxidase [Actinomadura pelletieri DSM 43383]
MNGGTGNGGTGKGRAGGREHVDAVVVGSGFGGSVAAYRLAEAGSSVVLLERGQPYPPGAFPRSPAEMGRAFWDPAAGLYGMYDVWSFNGCDSVVSAGLGGGSLIYANVLLRKDENWFVNDLPGGAHEPWPISRADLDPHYDAVERMIGATPYPLDRVPYDNTPKTHAMQDAAAELGLQCTLPPLAVSFAERPGGEPGISLPIVDAGYGNIHGVPRRTCQLCGECDIGCNEGAKNSLDHNYLSAAAHHGADIRTCREVTALRPRRGGGYEVDYVHHEVPTDPYAVSLKKRRRLPVRTITCDRLVLGAGTYGTTYLLLRSREAFPGLSDALGTRFSGNGDLLTFLLRATDRNRVRPLNASRGPVITTAIRLADELDGAPGTGRGAYIQDGGYPGFTDWIVDGYDVANDFERVVKFLWERFTDMFRGRPDTNLSQEISELIGDGALTVSSLPLLGMGRDTADGRLRLRDGMLSAEWTTETSRDLFHRVRRTMRGIADVLGADYADNPMWFRKRIITVHPLGGAPMGAHPGEGVCDAFGEVFGYPGLYIADGAAMPGPVGPNPSLTIAAQADRMATRLLEHASAQGGAGGPAVTAPSATGAEPGGDSGSPDGAGDGPPRETRHGRGGTVRNGSSVGGRAPRGDGTSLWFTEEMKGFVTYGESDPRAGGRAEGRRPLSFRLTITADDIDRFVREPGHEARAEGWVDVSGHGGRRRVERGTFNLFVDPSGDADATVDRRLMRYRLFYTDGEGRARTLSGTKNVLHGPPTRIWPDTSTLYVRLLDGRVGADEEDEGRAEVVAAGVLNIRLTDFARQLTTFRTSGPDGAETLLNFGRFFAGELWEVYGPDLV